MDLNTITAVAHPTTRDQLPVWTAGDAWLAGGTWLFSEPQIHLSRLIDLTDLKWPALTVTETELLISATCTVAQLDALSRPPEWIASPLINQGCRAFLASFKIWKTATVGGNICMSLPAGPMISLTSALDGVCTIWRAGGGERRISVADFVTGNQANVLAPGDLLRQVDIPLAALRRRSAFRQISLTPVGRSAALLIGSITGDQRNVLAPGDLLRQVDIPLAALRRRSAFRQISLTPVGRSAALLIGSVTSDGGVALTITASTTRPVRLTFAGIPNDKELRETILQRIADDLYHTDLHGKPTWRKHMTLRLAEEIRVELRGAA